MSDDFFSNVPLRQSSPTNDVVHDDFAHAISIRFGSTDLRTARLLPDDRPSHQPQPKSSLPHPQPQLPPPRPPSPPPSFISISPSALAPYLVDPRALILDIRPHAAHAAARVKNALSLSVPTTLLKRPLFSLSKLSQMLPSSSSRARFADWSSASCIFVYDSDSTSSPDNSIITGLLRKFRAEGFTNELGWVRGGFQAVWKEDRHLTTTELPSPEEDPDTIASPGTLRTTQLPKAAFSLSSTTAAHPPQLGAIPGLNPFPNNPAPSASRAANPFFDTIRQNVELSHGITERIPLRLPRRVRRRIPDLPSRWLQDIARRSAVRNLPTSRHSGVDGLESGSESSDDHHTSDPDETDPNVEEGAEALAMQFYRIELAEQRRLRSIMEHHTRESQVSASSRLRRVSDKDGGGLSARTSAKSVPGTPHLATFPFSITAAVEKGTKNRYTHIWPFEHARVRLHDGRHQGYHLGRRDKGKASERGRSTRERSGAKAKEREVEGQEQDKQRRSRSSPAFGKAQDQEMTEMVSAPPRHSFYFDARSSTAATGAEAELAHSNLSSSLSVPRLKIEYDTTEQDQTLEPPTPVTALPLLTPPFYTPMEILPAPTPMRSQPPQLLSLPSGISVSPGGRLEGVQVALSSSSVPYFGSLSSFPLRSPNHPGGLSPSVGEQTRASVSVSPSAVPFGAFTGRVGGDEEAVNDIGMMHHLRREPSPVDDYVNASYVQPLCTRKRYIATQGPLPSTYVDFWTLVWEQNVHVIVMLTREVENAMIKCGAYWTDAEYGPLRLKLLSTSPPISPSANSTTADISQQGFFAIREPQGRTSGVSDQPTLITRMFVLSHTSYPGVPPRKIMHLQYLDWSDMNVPDDPRGVLDLVKKVEQVVAESTPGSSPSGSLSPGSASGSPSGCQSPGVSPDQKGYDTSLLSPTSAGSMPWGRRTRRGSEWRHPELDPKSGIATFALGKPSPVLLHCSAGVGRTGGFIAVDAVLDAIRTELRRNREMRKSKRAPWISVVANREEATAELSAEHTETGFANYGQEDVITDESERMDVDEPTVDWSEKTRVPLQMIHTVPIHVSAGDHTKSHKRQHDKDHSDEKQSSSQESLVVHVPYAGTNDVPEGKTVPDIGFGVKEADWQSSTREWVEKVSDQTHTHAEDRSLPPLLPFPPTRREASPCSTSNGSGSSASDSVDESMSRSPSANASESAGARSGVGNRAERNSDTGSAAGSGTGSGSGRPPLSSISKPGSGSVSFSTSGSGTGSGSQFGSSLLGARLRYSSVTSVSVESMDSLSPEPKSSAPLHRPLTIHTDLSSDMEIDCPPRPVSVPVQRGPRHGAHLRFTSPIPLATADRSISFFGSDAAEGPTSSRPSSDPGSEELTTSPAELESGDNVGAEGKNKKNTNTHRLFQKSSELAVSSKSKTNLRLNTKLVAVEAVHSTTTERNLPLVRQVKSKERAIPLAPRVLGDPSSRHLPAASGVLGAFEKGRHTADHLVIDYKLPRELHSDLSPPLISSFEDPVCTIIQDMREQRMSLCQSLRQYVFVHAAIIEGALRIVDEEREIWGYSWTSDEASSGEGEPGMNAGNGGQESGHCETKVWFGGAEVATKRPEPEHGSVSHRTHSLHPLTQLSKPLGGGQVPLGPTSSSGVPSPSKMKRAPSPTELLREDKTGALSLHKRHIIHHKRTSDEDDQFSFSSRASSPVAGEKGEEPADIIVGVGATRAQGRLAVPEKGGPAFRGAR